MIPSSSKDGVQFAPNLSQCLGSSDDKMKNDIVFVWDMEDITTLSSKQTVEFVRKLKEQYPTLRFHDLIVYGFLQVWKPISKFETLELDRLDNIEDTIPSQPMIDSTRIDRKYAEIKKNYNMMSDEIKTMKDINRAYFRNFMKRDNVDEWMKIILSKYFEAFGAHWARVKQCLELVNQKSEESDNNFANVVICKDPIGHGLTQLKFAIFLTEVPIENVYSTAKASKKSIFERIQKRFGEKTVLLSVTSDPETFSIAKELCISVFSVSDDNSFERLLTLQRDHLLQ